MAERCIAYIAGAVRLVGVLREHLRVLELGVLEGGLGSRLRLPRPAPSPARCLKSRPGY